MPTDDSGTEMLWHDPIRIIPYTMPYDCSGRDNRPIEGPIVDLEWPNFGPAAPLQIRWWTQRRTSHSAKFLLTCVAQQKSTHSLHHAFVYSDDLLGKLLQLHLHLDRRKPVEDAKGRVNGISRRPAPRRLARRSPH